jgi:hypothetical protein
MDAQPGLALIDARAAALRAHAGPRPENGCAVAGMVLAGLALVPFYGFFFAIAGAIVSGIGIRQTRNHIATRRIAVAALTAAVTLAAAQVALVFAFCYFLRFD